MGEEYLPPALELPIIGYPDFRHTQVPDRDSESLRVDEERMRLSASSSQSLAALRLFAEVLTVGRLGRGWTGSSRWDLRDHPSPAPTSREDVILPHVFRHDEGRSVGVIFERVPWATALEVLGASRSTVERWSATPAKVVELVSMAPRRVVTDGYLSFRWVVNNEIRAATALSRGRAVSLEHVSLSVDESDLEWVSHLMGELVGLIEVSRPSSISAPGRWFVAGEGMIHLNGRDVVAVDDATRGSAPNHVALRIGSLDEVVKRLEAAGVDHVAGGSLGDRTQVWIHLPGGSVLELQSDPHEA